MKRSMALGLWLLSAWGATVHAQADPRGWWIQADNLEHLGENNPGAAIGPLRALAMSSPLPSAVARRTIALDIGLLAAVNGLADERDKQIDALLALGRAGDPLASAAVHLVRAQQAIAEGRPAVAYDEAHAGAQAFEPGCAPVSWATAGCDNRAWWRALQQMQFGAAAQGRYSEAEALARAMLDVARRAGDAPHEAMGLVTLAMRVQGSDAAGAARLVSQADQLAAHGAAAWLQAWLALQKGLMAHERHQVDLERRWFETGLSVAQAAGLLRTEVILRTHLSGAWIAQHQPARALREVTQALPTARRLHDRQLERLLRHNAILAELALGRVAQARAELPQVLQLLEATAAEAPCAAALRDLGDALGRAGDTEDALKLFHRERALASELRAADRRAAEAEMHARYDPDAQQSRIELVARENVLKAARIDNDAMQRRLRMGAALAVALLAALAALFYRRTRAMGRILTEREAQLRSHSERDALTGLANRRRFRKVMQAHGGEREFRGSLMMVDIDHFKRINDRHGHAAGDRVLVEVARQLSAAMRASDLVTRWGGEEFLVFAPRVDGTELQALAERIRAAIAGSPVLLDGGQALSVTVSIGHAAYPMPGIAMPMNWEQATRLADQALYAAKRQGRNRAVGVLRADIRSQQALERVEADLMQAHTDGVVTLGFTPQA